MNPSLIPDLAYLSDDFVNGPIKAIILRLAGLNGTTAMRNGFDAQELEWAHAGGLIVFPYYNPWAWMSPETVDFLDELIDGLLTKYDLPKSTPIIATGGSMGGHAALTYTLKSRHAIARCLAICPVADLPFHYTERPDLPRTMHSAFRSYGDITKMLEEYSPVHQAARMPKIPYLIIHGEKDKAVGKARHSDALVHAMEATGHRDVTYLELPFMEHCNPWDYASQRAATDFVLQAIN